MEAFSALLAICARNSQVTGGFSAQRSVTRSFDVFFDLRLNKRLSKQSWDWWFEAPSSPLWHHSNVNAHFFWRHNAPAYKSRLDEHYSENVNIWSIYLTLPNTCVSLFEHGIVPFYPELWSCGKYTLDVILFSYRYWLIPCRLCRVMPHLACFPHHSIKYKIR